ncbi:TfoX/Sxy family protein [Microbacterium lushaniae]|uniref:TfoX/Sxy family protein n=2 Tax=Microbacterium lushaniae TaxID=2614639 RepID=A0A5J6L8V3_9MICO|nr:TfoX/Sxy family protein [Microbacterium lushaniae]
MFGGLSFMVDDRMAVAAGRVGDLLVRVNPADYDALLDRGGVPAYMGKDRPMGPGWLSVPSERVDEDDELAQWIDVGIHSGDGRP